MTKIKNLKTLDLRTDILFEMKARLAAQKSMANFCRYISEANNEPARHHLYMIQQLEKLIADKNEKEGHKKLMIFMPPGHAKTSYASLLFVAYYLSKFPEHTIITASHTQHFATRLGRKVRNLIESQEFKNVSDVRLSPQKKSAASWETDVGGEYFAIGVGGAVTGRRADLILIDDPIKGYQEADSLLIRDKIWDWYLSDLRTRLKPKGCIILIQTRWHIDDLAGRILTAEGQDWDVLKLKALAEDEDDPLGRKPGEALWPEWMSEAQLLKEKQLQPARNWCALYQQEPIEQEGAYFKQDWVRYYEDHDLPDLSQLRVYGASDYAVSSGQGDYTVHGVMGLDSDDNMYLLDLWRGREHSHIWVEIFLDMMDQYKPIIWAEESGQIAKSLGPFIDKRQQERRIYGVRQQFSSTSDKQSRARSIQARMAMGKVFFPRNRVWVKDLLVELLHFPASQHDDQVDVLSLFGRMLDQMRGQTVNKNSQEVKLSPLFEQHFGRLNRLRNDLGDS